MSGSELTEVVRQPLDAGADDGDDQPEENGSRREVGDDERHLWSKILKNRRSLVEETLTKT